MLHGIIYGRSYVALLRQLPKLGNSWMQLLEIWNRHWKLFALEVSRSMVAWYVWLLPNVTNMNDLLIPIGISDTTIWTTYWSSWYFSELAVKLSGFTIVVNLHQSPPPLDEPDLEGCLKISPEGQHPVADSKSTRALATASTTGGQRWVESNGEGRGKGWALQNHRSQTAKCYFWSEDPNAEVARKCVKTKCAFMPWEKRPDEVRLPETLSSYRTGPKDLRNHTWKQLLEATSHTGNLLVLLACVCVCVH